MLNAMANVEAGISGASIPSMGDKKKTKKKKIQKKETDEEIFRVIANPDKMLDSPKDTKHATKSLKKSNLGKKKKKTSSESSMSSFGSSGSSSSGSSGSSMSSHNFMKKGKKGSKGSSNGSSTISMQSGDSYKEREKFTKKKRKEEIRQEKFVMLTRISSLSKNGISTRKKFSMEDDIDDIRFECYRMTREKNSQKAIKTMQQMLISAATFIEFGNMMFDPFNLKLNGFSKNMLLTVSDYDDSLEEIHHKWSGKTSIGPEVMVMFSFITSAIFHHAGNTTQKPVDTSTSTPVGGGGGGGFMNFVSNMIPTKPKAAPKPPKTSETGFGFKAPSESTEEKSTSETPKKRKPMKGPTASPFSGLVSSMSSID